MTSPLKSLPRLPTLVNKDFLLSECCRSRGSILCCLEFFYVARSGLYAQVFSASNSVTEIVRTCCPQFLMGSVMFFVQTTLQNVNVALGQAKSTLALAVTRKVVILIPLCFFLTSRLGFRGVYLPENIADLTAGVITSIVLFTSFPRIFKRRAGTGEKE